MIRYLNKKELNLIKCLLENKIEQHYLSKLNTELVNDLLGDGLSIEFFIKKEKISKIEYEVNRLYYDSDGVPIIIYITVNKNGELFDMDIWKADGSEIITYPQGKGNTLQPGQIF